MGCVFPCQSDADPEVPQGVRGIRKPPTPWIEKFSKDDLWKIEQAKKPWGNYEKARKLWASYMEEPGFEYLTRR